MTTAENKSLSGAGGSGVEFAGNEVDEHEADQERNEDTEVTPDMAVAVGVVQLDVAIAVDGQRTGLRAGGGATECITGQIGVGGDEG